MSDAFALENFAPPETVTFRLRKHPGQDFVVDADPDTADILRMLRVEEQIRNAEAELETVEAAEEGKQLLLRMIQERQPDITEIRSGMQEVLAIFSLIIRGESVATAVAHAISNSGGEGAPGEEDPGAPVLELPENGDEAEDGVPLASARLSSEQSSGSAERDAGLLATGTA